MRLRPLELKDAEHMIEWMHDPSVVGCLQNDFLSKTIEDCKSFIGISSADKKNMHLAIVDNLDEYMGTVSLKHIKNGSAEFAIVIRKIAMGKGFSKAAMEQIIRIGFDELKLNRIYWCVSPDNLRALNFYDKNGYIRVPYEELTIEHYTPEQIDRFIWYCITRSSDLHKED